MIRVLILTALLLSGCGANMLSLAEKSDPAEDALIAMEKGKPDEAISILEAALEDEPNNYLYISLLASAVVQNVGFEPLQFAMNLATQSDDDSGDGITTLISALPSATDAVLAGFDRSITLLESIPADDRADGDHFKLSMYYTANMALLTAQVGSLVTGEFSIEDLQNLTEEQALAILESLLGASSAIAMYDQADGEENAGSAAAQIESIRDEIYASEGNTSGEKLRNYFAAQNTEQ